MTQPKNYLLAQDVSLTQIDNEMVILNLSTGGYFGLNHIGAALLLGIQEQTSIEKIAAEIAAQYDTELEQVVDDANELIVELLSQKLIIESD